MICSTIVSKGVVGIVVNLGWSSKSGNRNTVRNHSCCLNRVINGCWYLGSCSFLNNLVISTVTIVIDITVIIRVRIITGRVLFKIFRRVVVRSTISILMVTNPRHETECRNVRIVITLVHRRFGNRYLKTVMNWVRILFNNRMMVNEYIDIVWNVNYSKPPLYIIVSTVVIKNIV